MANATTSTATATVRPTGSRRDELGQVMTPSDVANYMASQLSPDPWSTVLDPGAGAGALSLAVLRLFPSVSRNQLTLVELDEEYGRTLRQNEELAGSTVFSGNFIEWATNEIISGKRWDRIVANPPYLNYHNFDRATIIHVNRITGINFSQLTNSYALFMALCSRLLAHGGRMVFITPTELLTTNYGRVALSALCGHLDFEGLTVFEPGAEPFEDAATSSCVTSFVRRELKADSLRIAHVTSRSSSEDKWILERTRALPVSDFLKAPKEAVWRDWQDEELPPERMCPLGSLVHASRGIATGANSFFTVDSSTRMAIDPDGRYTVPVLSHAKDLSPKLTFEKKDFQRLVDSGSKNWLLYIVGSPVVTDNLEKYLNSEEGKEVRTRYLCRLRSPWYSSESQGVPIGFVRVFGRDGMKVVLNHGCARTLTCFHRLYHYSPPRITEDGLLLLAVFLQSRLGEKTARVQYRRYGSGLLKLEPADLEQILVPDLRRVGNEVVSLLAQRARETLVDGKIHKDKADEIAQAVLSSVSASASPTGLDSWATSDNPAP